MDIAGNAPLIVAGLVLLAALELVGTVRFWPWVYRVGLPLSLGSRATGLPPLQGGPGTSEDFQALVVHQQIVLFHAPVRLDRSHFQFRAVPIPFKGVLRQEHQGLTLKGYMPLAPLLLFIAVPAVIILATTAQETGARPGGALHAVIPGGLGLIIFTTWFFGEKQRLERAADALLAAVSGQGRAID